MGEIIKTAWVAAIVLLLCSSTIRAQQRYQTREGMVEVIGSYRDSRVIATSDHLFIVINYQTAEIGLSLDPATLRTETDSLNVILINSPLMPVILEGKLNIPYVNTLQQPDQELNFTALLHMNKIVKTIYANGAIKHSTGNDNFSSLLTLNFKLRLSDFGIVLLEGWSDEITIQIYQAMLKTQ
ncbi:hypothetical protein CXF59_10355 [Flavobacterium sp. ALD4]|uniref:hypothetical protein n=1 Tax=Flavobacterium sp. ALD4 TaxID=2058314 RepID=UPI000C32BD4A|nr:hypothetical protein [Flavobacterium sp. ALD4]PKH66355.1 hypothetical protein CXF59_10355 [Flavobacterium sp. ALD4]